MNTVCINLRKISTERISKIKIISFFDGMHSASDTHYQPNDFKFYPITSHLMESSGLLPRKKILFGFHIFRVYAHWITMNTRFYFYMHKQRTVNSGYTAQRLFFYEHGADISFQFQTCFSYSFSQLQPTSHRYKLEWSIWWIAVALIIAYIDPIRRIILLMISPFINKCTK